MSMWNFIQYSFLFIQVLQTCSSIDLDGYRSYGNENIVRSRTITRISTISTSSIEEPIGKNALAPSTSRNKPEQMRGCSRDTDHNKVPNLLKSISEKKSTISRRRTLFDRTKQKQLFERYSEDRGAKTEREVKLTCSPGEKFGHQNIERSSYTNITDTSVKSKIVNSKADNSHTIHPKETNMD